MEFLHWGQCWCWGPIQKHRQRAKFVFLICWGDQLFKEWIMFHSFSLVFLFSISLILALIYFLPSVCSWFHFALLFSSLLKWKTRLLIWNFSFFLSATDFPLKFNYRLRKRIRYSHKFKNKQQKIKRRPSRKKNKLLGKEDSPRQGTENIQTQLTKKDRRCMLSRAGIKKGKSLQTLQPSKI